ncbi:YchJ family protein [Marinobacterium sp. D7]|uniref:YchJ family protein n=1 Tax=Marinobacterium ramblicola TaxID=2849041 RepID=UPI001C2D2BD0|nr:YchJ family protein [Marinobacterium ramblicola]MBV1789079.1 YchJ family protein [Marinobacterium ramblicola]
MLHDTLNSDQPCPCGSGRTFNACCEPALSGVTPAATAEALMRSRYSAFALGAVDYLIDTLAPEKRQPGEAELLAEQTQVTTWTGLTILDTQAGGPQDSIGVVEFEARFDSGPDHGVLHERSRFRRENGRWLYVDGDVQLKRV